jgi:hypothetical protein
MSQNQKNGSDPLGKSTKDCGHENDGNELNELKLKMMALQVFLNYYFWNSFLNCSVTFC